MRILAIGLGGAGCRIADALYANDRKSSKVTCVQALAVDIDSSTLAELRALPEQARIDFMVGGPEPELSPQGPNSPGSATIDIGEIMARIQNMERGETDAILICCGLGGRMTDVAPHLISAIRASVTEPIFGLVTLPTLSEGEKRSAKAADDIDNLAPLLDGTILFDNETWSKKIAARRDALIEEIAKGPGLLGLGRNPPKLSAQEITYKLLNQSIIRRISLLLRAGEFRADGGIDLAEVVMDSSEVLNTIKGMGFISIGYAVERLSQSPLAFFSRLRTANATLEQRKSAERIIELAKQAIYQEVSIPCDMTSAAKALILVAGPSHEISMKGFMTVRKWIDRSIAGMEMRSGDYPVTNSEYVAIIVVLSGLENIPRISELREIREQFRSGDARDTPSSFTIPPREGLRKAGGVSEITAVWNGTELRDDMISLPGEKPKKRGPLQSPAGKSDQYPDVSSAPVQEHPPVARTGARPRILEERGEAAGIMAPSSPDRNESLRKPAVSQREPRIKPPGPVRTGMPVRQYPISEGQDEGITRQSPHQESRPVVRRPLESGYEASLPLKHIPVKSRNTDNQKIEHELQRKQVIIPSGSRDNRENQVVPVRTHDPYQLETKTIIRRVVTKAPVHRPEYPAEPAAPVPAKSERTIIRRKKKETETEGGLPLEESGYQAGPAHQGELELAAEMDTFSVATPLEEIKIGIKDRLQPARDDIFLGKAVSQKEPLRVKDAALLHTEIKIKKGRPGTEGERPDRDVPAQTTSSKKKTGKSTTQDDEISWVSD